MAMMRWLAGAATILAAGMAQAQAPPPAPIADWARPSFAPDGTASVPAFALPPSSLSSAPARAQQAMRARMPASLMQAQEPDVVKRRAQLDRMLAPQVAKDRETYPVDVVEQVIGGVPVRIVTPKGGGEDGQRVLINLHGGAFSVCWDACSLLESVPIAALGKYKVISVNYRMAPEARHPAALEDVAKVYAALLKTYAPRHVGIYGCSAGGALTAEAAAWLPAHGLPQAGAIGIFGAGAVPFGMGDSGIAAAYIDGSFPPANSTGMRDDALTRGYFAGMDMREASIAPGLHDDALAKFPPALIITGTRAMDMSPAVFTNSRLIKAGVPSTLIVGEGMGHCYIYSAGLPEAQDAYAAIVGFFRKALH